MEEPKKVLKAQYLGSMEVQQPTGMEVINQAIDVMLNSAQPEAWINSNVSVAPSMISVNASGEDGRLLAECRVRYLSFLGIGKNVKNCAFIMHTAQDKFVAHVFQCEPSSGALCKTIEAACKVTNGERGGNFPIGSELKPFPFSCAIKSAWTPTRKDVNWRRGTRRAKA